MNWCMLRQSRSEESKAKSDLREWAVKGAEQRLVELAEEARTIFTAFPELRSSESRCRDREGTMDFSLVV